MPETYEALTYGCYVITTMLDDRRFGMTCCWATQIDFDRILLCLGEQSATGKVIRQSKVFGVNVLKLGQKKLAIHFGEGHSDEIDKFEGLKTRSGQTGVPLLPGSQKAFECELDNDSIFEQKNLFVGRIVHFQRDDSTERPLLLFDIDGTKG